MKTFNRNKRNWMETEREAIGLKNPMDNVRRFRNKEERYVLSLAVHVVEGVDSVSKYPEVTRRDYKVFAWINPEEQFHTDEADGLRRVKFDQELFIPFYKDNDVPLEIKFVSLEVVRLRSRCDPGPSRGQVVVGRLRVRLPKEPLLRKSNRFGLARLVDGQILGEGHISVSMKVIPYYDY